MKKNRKQSIAIFSAYLSPHVGGIERYVDHLSKQFVLLGYHPIIVTSNYNGQNELEEKDGITIIRLPIYKIFKNRYPIVKRNRCEKSLLKQLDSYQIHSIIVNTRFHLTSHVGVSYARKHQIPVYLIEHGSNYVTLNHKVIDFFANRYEDFLTWKLKPYITGFYGVSKACNTWLKHFHISASGTWYNSIDCEQIVPEKQRHDTVNFLYAGRIIKQKGVENILRAFQNLVKKYDNIHLFIAGDGGELLEYQNQYQHPQISFLGKLEYSELLQYYAKTDIFLYPPLWPEGLPSSILEAGLMSCAVIATAQGGIGEIIFSGKNGIIVEETVKSLEQAMEKLIVDEDLRRKLAKQLHQTVRNQFSWDVTAKKILKDIKLTSSHSK